MPEELLPPATATLQIPKAIKDADATDKHLRSEEFAGSLSLYKDKILGMIERLEDIAKHNRDFKEHQQEIFLDFEMKFHWTDIDGASLETDKDGNAVFKIKLYCNGGNS